ncbi:hypothetical protein SLEP1_g27024 [Rubroshorea leprosula]|uniref:Uncharacterized protein n=1 Tax=Rubroshorea leprosula TaxID=152421 RepID=A0AAV5JYD2_9ROSI|nr:hypothetical protein SLEP1_g27024 [Rubroshorea leprosula]
MVIRANSLAKCTKLLENKYSFILSTDLYNHRNINIFNP